MKIKDNWFIISTTIDIAAFQKGLEAQGFSEEHISEIGISLSGSTFGDDTQKLEGMGRHEKYNRGAGAGLPRRGRVLSSIR